MTWPMAFGYSHLNSLSLPPRFSEKCSGFRINQAHEYVLSTPGEILTTPLVFVSVIVGLLGAH